MPDQTGPARRLAERHQRLVQSGESHSHRSFRERARRISGVLRLSSGEPDLPTPAHIVNAAQAALAAGQTRCTEPSGMATLRCAAADAIHAGGGPAYNPDTEIIVTAGTTQGVYLALHAILDPGDEVLIPDPTYPPFLQTIIAAGGTPVLLPTQPTRGFVPEAFALAEAITPRAKALLLISPGNPTGAVIDRETGAAIARVVTDHDLIVISDELYARFLYEGAQAVSFAALPAMRQRTVTLSGPSKLYSLTGMRVGFLAAPAWLTQAVLTWRELDSVCTTSISQHAALAALTGPQDCVAEALATYDARRRLIQERLAALGLHHTHPQGGAFLLANIQATGLSSLDFCTALLQERGVWLSPGSEYGKAAEGFVCFSYFTPDAVLAEGLAKFQAFYRAHIG